jgi:glycosyltransferase involved in cell wall biosynthesis
MRILQVHNKYRYHGGEDVVVDNEYKILKDNGLIVEQLLFDNLSISFSGSIYNREAAKKLRDIIIRFKPDLIHVHNLFYNASPSILYEAKNNGIPVVLTIHNYRLLCPSALLLRDSKVCTKCTKVSFPFYSIKYRCFQDSSLKSFALATNLFIHNLLKTWKNKVDKIIVLTPFAKDLILNSHLKLSKEVLLIKPNSTDDIWTDEKFDRKSNFLYVGRLSKEKGVDILIKAFNQLPDLTLNIVGTGDMEKQLKETANQNIVFHGKQDYSFVKSMYQRNKALLFPSICYEGLPNTIIEAFSAGLPVICSDIDNINQIVTSGYNGLTFELRNVSDLIKVINQFNNINDKELGKNARNSYLTKYTHKINFQNLTKIYKELI